MPIILGDGSHRADQAGGFATLAFGFPFLLDFRLFGIDVLADAIGFLLFYAGLKRLAPFHSKGMRLQLIALLLAFASLPKDVGVYPIPVGLARVFSLGVIPLTLWFVWNLVGLVIDFAKSLPAPHLRRIADVRRRLLVGWYLLVMTLSIFASALSGGRSTLSSDSGPVFGLVTLALLTTGIAVMALMVGLMQQAAKTLRTTPSSLTTNPQGQAAA